MLSHIIIIIAICLIYYHIGGLATTNILRLTSGNTRLINSSKCTCDSCGKKIPALLQLPIISFLVCKGRCRSCGAKIPIYPLIIELTVWFGMSLITALFKFDWVGVLFSYLFYETVRIITVVVRGKRETRFAYCYFVAVASMIPYVLCSLFASALYQVV